MAQEATIRDVRELATVELERIVEAAGREQEPPNELEVAAEAELVRRQEIELGVEAEPEPPEHRLIVALTKAQAAFPPIERRHTAEVRGKEGRAGYTYSYADLGDVLAAVRPVLAFNGLAITQRTIREDAKVILRTELRHIGGGILDSEVELGQSTSNPQQFGGALTYLRRYELVTLLGIAAEEDRDAQDVEPERRAGARPPELPAWAQPASRDRVGELGEALIPILGRDRVYALVSATKDTFGHVPDAVVGFAKGLGDALVAELGDELLGALERDRQARAEAAAAIAAQEAAEAPQEGPYEPAGETLEQRIATASDAVLSDAVEHHESESVRELAKAELDRRHPGEEDGPPPEASGETPPAGTVEPPDVSGLNLEDPNERDHAELAYREAGCICTDPLTAPHDDACPIKGHGIPF